MKVQHWITGAPLQALIAKNGLIKLICIVLKDIIQLGFLLNVTLSDLWPLLTSTDDQQQDYLQPPPSFCMKFGHL